MINKQHIPALSAVQIGIQFQAWHSGSLKTFILQGWTLKPGKFSITLIQFIPDEF